MAKESKDKQKKKGRSTQELIGVKTFSKYGIVTNRSELLYYLVSPTVLNDGIHEAIVSEELWNQVHKKRQETGVANIKPHSLDHEHILSGIIKCPICGSGMYGNVNRKKHPDGGYYKDYFYYACKHRTFVNGHKCTYRKQWSEEKINAAVEEVIRKLVNNPKYKTEIQKHIGQSIDTQELDREHTGLQERLKQVTGAKNKLANQMDNLSVSDKHYDKKYEEEQTDGRILRSLKFRFPVFFNGEEIYELDWDNESTVETIWLLRN